MKSWVLVGAVCLTAAACSKGAGVDVGDAGVDVTPPAADAARDTAPQRDAGDDVAPQSDAQQSDVLPQSDAATGSGCLEGSFTAYWGNLHAHTSYSDGTGSPAQAYDYARYTAGLDLLVLTDHVEQIPLNGGWVQYQAEADAKYVAGTFLTLAAFEYGSGFSVIPPASTGHNNVYFSPDLFGATDVDFHNFYSHLYACSECIGQFNHPGDGTTTSWSDFEYNEDADKRMNLLEFNSPVAWDQYFMALDAGWTVSPQWNQDNHGADWGTANDNRSGMWMSSLDRTALYDAMAKRRTFATADKKAWIKLMANDTCWMGSILMGYSTVSLTVDVDDTDGDHGFSTIELFGPGKTLLASQTCGGAMTCQATHELTVTAPPGATYALARATMTNGAILVSAPVWVALQ